VAAEKNSTLVLPFPVELLRFLEHAQGTAAASSLHAGNGVASRPAPAVAESVPEASRPADARD
jgi:hypothetical protein